MSFIKKIESGSLSPRMKASINNYLQQSVQKTIRSRVNKLLAKKTFRFRVNKLLAKINKQKHDGKTKKRRIRHR